jgi:Serine acetyltransferase
MTSNIDLHINELVDKITDSYSEYSDITNISSNSFINKYTIIDIIDNLQKLIFVGFFEDKHLRKESVKYYTGDLIENIIYNLGKQITRAFETNGEEYYIAKEKSMSIIFNFMNKIIDIRAILSTDVEAAFDGDPAAKTKSEIILSYPGLYAIMVNRIAHELYLLEVPLIPRMMTEHAHSLTGIDIHPGATIGHHFFIDHGTGIVIGETTKIENYVKIYQGVTLGALSTRGGQQLKNIKRHPTIKDRVTIYSGASILGGDTVIGADVIISSNAFIVTSVAANTRVSVHNPELQFRGNKNSETKILKQDDSWTS